MGLLKSLFGNNMEDNKGKDPLPWIMLTSLDQFDSIEKRSATRPQVIFKHSTTCGVSRMVLKGFQQNPVFKENTMDFYFLDLHSFRQISNQVSQKFQVVHQSPQVLVIKNSQVVAHDSHGGINNINLERFI